MWALSYVSDGTDDRISALLESDICAHFGMLTVREAHGGAQHVPGSGGLQDRLAQITVPDVMARVKQHRQRSS